jgi:hypothetical protein
VSHRPFVVLCEFDVTYRTYRHDARVPPDGSYDLCARAFDSPDRPFGPPQGPSSLCGPGRAAWPPAAAPPACDDACRWVVPRMAIQGAACGIMFSNVAGDVQRFMSWANDAADFGISRNFWQGTNHPKQCQAWKSPSSAPDRQCSGRCSAGTIFAKNAVFGHRRSRAQCSAGRARGINLPTQGRAWPRRLEYFPPRAGVTAIDRT